MSTLIDSYSLIQNIVDTQDDLILIIENNKPILLNQAFLRFFSVKSFEEYTQSYGEFSQHFVPHPSYFHAEKVPKGSTWVDSLSHLDGNDQIVSMINQNSEPRAFKATINNNHNHYSVVSFHDISADLIKRIMIENNVSIDKISGAYNKEYFMHTCESFYDGAIFNEKEIGLTLIDLDTDNSEAIKEVVTDIKKVIRQNDMLIKYSSNKLLLAYLVDSSNNAKLFSQKVFNVTKKSFTCKVALSLVKKNEKIPLALRRIESKLLEAEYQTLEIL